MLDDELDDKIKKAAQDGIPPFEEKDWDQMEALLDKHLPVKKDRRRVFFFLLLIPVGLGLGYFLYRSAPGSAPGEPAGRTKTQAVTRTIDTTDANPVEQNSTAAHKILTPGDNTKSPELPVPSLPAVEKNKDLISKSKAQKSLVTNNGQATTPITTLNKTFPEKTQPLLAEKMPKQAKTVATREYGKQQQGKELLQDKKETVNATANTGDAGIAKITTLQQPSSVAEQTKPDTTGSRQEMLSTQTTKENDSLFTEQTAKPLSEISTAQQKPKAAIEKKSSLHLTLTLGWQASGTALQNLGTLTPVYGAGLQYHYGRVFLRAGVLATQKIYAAKDKDYNRKSGTWMSAVTFDNIAADCRVIEVPLSLGYTLTGNKKTNVYVTVGSSAYFMKREDYRFYFKNSSGNDTTRSASFTNNSNHYFSSLNFSAGIEQMINRRLTLMAEPLLKIPVSGIGFGKIKLYGAGILLTGRYRLR